MGGDVAGQIDNMFVFIFLQEDSIGPEVGVSGADQQKMFKNVFEFLLFDPITIFISFYLKDVIVLSGNFNLSHLEYLPTPFALFSSESFNNMSFLETILQFIENLLLCTFQTHHTHSSYHLQNSLEIIFFFYLLCCLKQCFFQDGFEVVVVLLNEQSPDSMTVQP